MGNLKRWLLIGGGTASVIAGVIGIFIPILPTTPFLLLAAICYMRSSQRLYLALIRNRLCGSYIRNYLEGKRMSVKSKVLTLTLLWIVIGTTSIVVAPGLVICIIMLAAGIGVTIHLLLLHTAKSENVQQNEMYKCDNF